MEPRIIYEDKNFLAIDKPAGLLVHETKQAEAPTVVDWLLKHYPEIKSVGDDPKTRPGIVHRLDKDTSGILLVARNQAYFDFFRKLFQTRAIKKTYRALVYGKLTPKRGSITKAIKMKPGTIKRTVFKGKSEKEASTEYHVLRYSGSFSWIEVMPLSGRTHQIRVHLASLGHPVVGDKLYGPKKARENLPGVKRQLLHASSLEFSPSPGKRLKLAANLPEDIRLVLRFLESKK